MTTDPRNIAETYPGVPPGFSVDSATIAELREAGFDGREPGQPRAGAQPLDEMPVDGRQTVHVLRDPEGQIVATWNEGEGRWWTPKEWAALLEWSKATGR
ncbi:MAG: hypothetical protein ACM3QU_08915 [Verrucomicrobiota bacterium]